MPAGRHNAFQEAIKTFSIEDFQGAVRSAFWPLDLATAVHHVVDPANAEETLHWGRNYLYSLHLDTHAGRVEVVVKQFRNQGLLARFRRKLSGDRALKSWRGALAVMRAGVSTPEPVMVLASREPEGPSFYASRRLIDVLEARYFFRALNAGREREEFPGIDAQGVLEETAKMLRRLHDQAVWHRDVSIGNLLISSRYVNRRPEIFLIDLNRARVGVRMSVSRRTRDLCRLRIFQRRHQEILLGTYWGEDSRGLALKRYLYLLYFYGFLAKNLAKDLLRAPVGWISGLIGPRRPHVHIPEAAAEASKRDRVVWDTLSDQPHQHAGKFDRGLVRLADLKEHGKLVAVFAQHLPRIRRRYLELKETLYTETCPWEGIGVAVRPWEEDSQALIDAMEQLGSSRFLLRLHPWQETHAAEEALAREIRQRGWDLCFALPQSRELVRDLDRWRSAIQEIFERFRPYGSRFQVGQAINRSKWGVWNHREYVALVSAAAEILGQDDEVEIMGPAVIDYEFHVTSGILNLDWNEFHFDIVSSLLYVDRRGSPESRQLGFDTIDKVVQLKAIAETARAGSTRSWITEVNWPLWEGPHSPAGRHVSVSEETQADYLARYYLQALGTGMVERIYWWQLVARGYGLASPAGAGQLRYRPSFHALATLCRELEGSLFLGPVSSAQPAHLYHFRRDDGSEVVAGWSSAADAGAELPRPATQVIGRDGQECPVPSGPEITLSGSPCYFILAPE